MLKTELEREAYLGLS